MIESRLGIVFASREGQVMAAQYDADDWSVALKDEDYPAANGWRVTTLSGCCGDTIFPPWAG